MKNKLDIRVTREIRDLKMYTGIQVHTGTYSYIQVRTATYRYIQLHRATYISLMNRQFVVNRHNPSNWDSPFTRQFGYKHTFCQNTVHKLVLTFLYKNITCLSSGLLMTCPVLPVYSKTAYRSVTTSGCFMSDVCVCECVYIYIYTHTHIYICCNSMINLGNVIATYVGFVWIWQQAETAVSVGLSL